MLMLLFVLLYLLFILVHALPLPLNLFRNPLCEGEPRLWGWRCRSKKSEACDIMEKILVVLRLREPLVGTFWSKYVRQLLTLFVCSNEIDQRNHKSSHQLPPMPLQMHTQHNQLELNQIQNHYTVSTAHTLAPLKIYGVELIELFLDCNTFKNEVHPHKGDQKDSRRGVGCTSMKSKYNNMEKKHLLTLPRAQTISNFIH